jgi:hypothetical protein
MQGLFSALKGLFMQFNSILLDERNRVANPLAKRSLTAFFQSISGVVIVMVGVSDDAADMQDSEICMLISLASSLATCKERLIEMEWSRQSNEWLNRMMHSWNGISNERRLN